MIGKSLQTPTRIRSLQRKLYRKAKAEPEWTGAGVERHGRGLKPITANLNGTRDARWAAPQMPGLRLSNYSVLQKLYIAPAKTKNWSDDKLQNQTVGKNGRFTIHDVSKGIYDLKETDDDNDTCVFPNISVDQNMEWKLTDAMIDNCDEE